MSQIPKLMSFDIGVERVTTDADVTTARLPAADLLPGQRAYTQQLNELLTPPSLEETLLDSLQPPIRHPEMLGPVGYQSALRECHEALGQLSTTNTGKKLETLQRAHQLLQEEIELHELLTSYRHLLHEA